MTERWRDKLGRLGREEPDRDRIRSLSEGGPRMPPVDGDPGTGRRVLAAVVALVVATGSIALVVTVFRGGTAPTPVASATGPTTGRPTDSTSAPATSVPTVSPTLDPAAICDVPPYDPDVTLLVGQGTVELPAGRLDGPGQPASALDGPATDEFRARLATPALRFAPEDGWRTILSSEDAVTFAAPTHDDEWFVVGFENHDGTWGVVNEEIASRTETPAQAGHGLNLRWDGDLILRDGAWNDPLRLVNGRAEPWTADQSVVAVPHLFDPATGALVGPGAFPLDPMTGEAGAAPGAETSIPVALGASLTAASVGKYRVVACIPELGLASPETTLRVEDDAVVPGAQVLTFAPTGAYVQPLYLGNLVVRNGCLASREQGGDRETYVVLPQGYAFVVRGGEEVLIDPLGRPAAKLGDAIEMTGGTGSLNDADREVLGGVPESCREDTARYVFTPSV